MTIEEAIELLEEVKVLDDSMYQYNHKYLEALDMAIKSLEESTNICWIVGKDREQVAFKNMPVDKAEKILAIINGEAEEMRDATEQERKSIK